MTDHASEKTTCSRLQSVPPPPMLLSSMSMSMHISHFNERKNIRKGFLTLPSANGARFDNLKAQGETVLNLRKFLNYFKNLAMCRVGGGGDLLGKRS